MTSAAQPNFVSRVLDIVFGKPVTPDGLAAAARPPRVVTDVLFVLHLVSFGCMLVTLLWSWGLLPFVEFRISQAWFFGAWGANLMVRFGQEWVAKYYRRRAEAGEALKAASPE